MLPSRQGDQGMTKVGKRIFRVVSSVWALCETRITVVPDVNNHLITFLILLIQDLWSISDHS